MNAAILTAATPSVNRGEWTIGVLYYVDDIVLYLGAGYRCLQEHPGRKRHTPGAAPFFWLLVT